MKRKKTPGFIPCRGRSAPTATGRAPMRGDQSPVEADYREAERLLQAGALAAALERYCRVLEASPQHARAAHGLGIVAQRAGNLALAAELMEHSLRLEPRQPEFHYHLGSVYRLLGRLDKAAARYHE